MQNYSSLQSLQPDRQQMRIEITRHVQEETELFKKRANQHRKRAAPTELT